MMPRLRFGILLLVVAMIVLAGWMLTRNRGAPVSFRLLDGSELILARITQGSKHEMPYGKRWQDYLSPILNANLQAKLGCKVASLTPANSNSMVLWLWQKQIPSPLARQSLYTSDYFLTTVDTNGFESTMLHSSSCSYSTSPGSNLRGWELKNFPRRGGNVGIRIYMTGAQGQLVRVGAFNVPNRKPLKTPGWVPQTLPATIKTNDLEVTLVKLETGLTAEQAGLGSRIAGSKAFSLAVFAVRERGKPARDWNITGLKAAAASGEQIEPGNARSTSDTLEQEYAFTGALWPDEPAWKLKVEITRSASYPAEELWTIKGVPVPKVGEVTEVNAKTNIYGAQIEFTGVSGPDARLPLDWQGRMPYANIHARSPIPMSDTYLKLVEVRDDQGRKIAQRGMHSSSSTSGRGATLRESNHGFGIEIPGDSKTLDITFAFTRSRYVEFLAKPVLAK
jgi:hypothetical protein